MMRKQRRPTEAASMPEAEVTLRLAFWLLRRAEPKSHADIAIDGAHVRIAAHEQAGRHIEERTVFDIQSFLAANKCDPRDLKDQWRGTYGFEGHTLRIRSVQSFDVQVACDGMDIKAECKGGLLQPSGRALPLSLPLPSGRSSCLARVDNQRSYGSPFPIRRRLKR